MSEESWGTIATGVMWLCVLGGLGLFARLTKRD